MTENRLKALTALGQSVWYDYIRRDLIRRRRARAPDREDGLTGMTSNPTIFEKAIAGERAVRRGHPQRGAAAATEPQVFEALAIARRAVGRRRLPRASSTRRTATTASSRSRSGPGSRTTPPGSIAEARRLWSECDRPNVMVKIPGHRRGRSGDPAVPVGGHQHQHHAALLRPALPRGDGGVPLGAGGARRGRQAGRRMRSVASFFVSRVDTNVDQKLDAHRRSERATPPEGEGAPRARSRSPTRGSPTRPSRRSSQRRAGRRSKAKGARRQRPLWASTSTKDPAFPDLYYVEALIAPDSVDTMPPETFEAYRDHGDPKVRIRDGRDEAHAAFQALAGARDRRSTRSADELEDEGVKKFIGLVRQPHEDHRRETARDEGGLNLQPDGAASRCRDAAGRLTAENAAERIWSGDASFWRPEALARKHIESSLGWLTLPDRMAEGLPALQKLAAELRAEADRVVVVGAGGAALSAELYAGAFPPVAGFPRLSVLDSTEPSAVAAAASALDPARTVFVVSSRTGSTLETSLLFDFLWDAAVRRLGDEARRAPVRRRHGAGVGPRDRGREAPRAGAPAGRPRHAGGLRAALPLRPGSRGALGLERRRGARARPRDGRSLPHAGRREPGPAPRGRARSRGARRLRQAHLLRVGGASSVRDLDRGPDRVGDRQGRQGHRAGRRRAARRSRGLRIRPLLRAPRAGRCARTRTRTTASPRSWSTAIPWRGSS